jgi:hypothetical protein
MDKLGADLATRISERRRAVAIERERHRAVAFGRVDRGIGG